MSERGRYRALSTPGLSESLVEGAGWDSAAPGAFAPLLVSLVMPGWAGWLLGSLIEPVSVPAPPPAGVPASWLRSRPLQPARTMATRPAAACEVHRMGDTLSFEAFSMREAVPMPYS